MGRTTLLLLLGSVSTVSLGAPVEDQVHSKPKPYGHTSLTHPTNAARDREWYVEARWKQGGQYPVQDGPITEKPAHAPTPPDYDGRQYVRRSFRKLNNPGHKESADATNGTSVQAAAPVESFGNGSSQATAEPAGAVDSFGSGNQSAVASSSADDNSAKGNSSLRLGDRTVPEVKYAVPKPHGHTSMVHPYHGNRDREWYVEARWKPGTEYKPQDGVITEHPQHAPRSA